MLTLMPWKWLHWHHFSTECTDSISSLSTTTHPKIDQFVFLYLYFPLVKWMQNTNGSCKCLKNPFKDMSMAFSLKNTIVCCKNFVSCFYPFLCLSFLLRQLPHYYLSHYLQGKYKRKIWNSIEGLCGREKIYNEKCSSFTVKLHSSCPCSLLYLVKKERVQTLKWKTQPVLYYGFFKRVFLHNTWAGRSNSVKTTSDFQSCTIYCYEQHSTYIFARFKDVHFA